MPHLTGTFIGANETELFTQAWTTPNPRAVVALVHGVGEHSGRHINTVNFLTQKGISVYGFDLRGHGKSPGKRGFINSWDEYREDVGEFLQMVYEREPDKPVFLMGHSLGGVMVLDYALHYNEEPLAGVIASAPGLDAASAVSPVLVLIAKVMSLVAPKFSLPLDLDTSKISRQPEEVKKYEDDSLNHSQGTARMGAEYLKTCQTTLANAAQMAHAVYLFHGTADGIVSHKATQKFFDGVQMSDKTLKLYEGAYHEMHNDLNREEMWADLLMWIESHLS